MYTQRLLTSLSEFLICEVLEARIDNEGGSGAKNGVLQLMSSSIILDLTTTR